MTALPLSERTTLRDDDLLVLIAQGDEQALGTFYDRYGRLVYTITLRLWAPGRRTPISGRFERAVEELKR